MQQINTALYVLNVKKISTVLMLHGFTGSHKAMEELSRLLPYDCAVPDLIGHGRSPCPVELSPYRMEEMVKQLDDVMRVHLRKPIDLLGYSMGARLALTYAMDRQEAINALVLIGGTAGIVNDEDRQLRSAQDSRIAANIEEFGLERFVRYWENRPIFTSQKALSLEKQEKMRRIRLGHRTHGLANHLRMAGTGVMGSLWHKLEDLTMPVLLIAGERDHKFIEIAESMKEKIPNSEIKIIVDAGHATHYEKPKETSDVIVQFLKNQGR
jgi:2-succinyl-6-hydroxy-2,4-cyclohexadiene-1-carboxylate synthase